MHSAPGFILKFLFVVMATMFILTVTVAMLQYSDKNGFEHYVNATIERNGGLTSSAVNDIQNYSMTAFNDRFKLATAATGRKAYGELVEYTYEFKIVPVFMQFDTFTFTDTGIATSKVR